MAVYAKFEGVDGESKDANHDKWIDVLSTDWGTTKPTALPTAAPAALFRDPTK